MIGNGIITQIGTAVVAVAILVTYVQPRFKSIGETQDNIVVYQTEREKIKSINQQLSTFISVIDSVSLDDERRILRYLPDTIDEVSVQRDLVLIARKAGISFVTASYTSKGSSEGQVKTSSGGTKSFDVSAEVTYDQLKDFLELLEQNEYPLQVNEMSVSLLEGGFLSAELKIDTYIYHTEDEVSDSNSNEVNV